MLELIVLDPDGFAMAFGFGAIGWRIGPAIGSDPPRPFVAMLLGA